jgi:hypothetical protein
MRSAIGVSLRMRKYMKKEKLILYGRTLKSSDILDYLAEEFKKKLSKSERKAIEDAFYRTVKAYQAENDEKYLDRILA